VVFHQFVLIVRNVNLPQLEELGNRIRILVENSYIVIGKARLRVTISLGASLARDSDSVESLFKRADDLLYRSKEEGRNRLTAG
jgi:diguanylate cyclase (GGDEF)-like protein